MDRPMTPTPSRLSEERLREIERENVCLIPREGSRNPIVCHEKATLCAHEVSQMARELREARGLLSEAADWLCEHAEAREAWAEGTGRAWCSDCHNYLRSDADATLKDRIRAAAREGEKP